MGLHPDRYMVALWESAEIRDLKKKYRLPQILPRAQIFQPSSCCWEDSMRIVLGMRAELVKCDSRARPICCQVQCHRSQILTSRS